MTVSCDSAGLWRRFRCSMCVQRDRRGSSTFATRCGPSVSRGGRLT